MQRAKGERLKISYILTWSNEHITYHEGELLAISQLRKKDGWGLPEG